MANENESVIIYQTWFESVGLLGKDKQIKAMMQIIRYGLYGEVPDNSDDVVLQAVMMTWFAQVDAQKKKRKGGAPSGNQNAKGHGAPKGNKNATKKTNNKNKQPFNVNGNVNDNGNVINNDNNLPSVGSPAFGEAENSTSEEEPDWLRKDE